MKVTTFVMATSHFLQGLVVVCHGLNIRFPRGIAGSRQYSTFQQQQQPQPQLPTTCIHQRLPAVSRYGYHTISNNPRCFSLSESKNVLNSEQQQQQQQQQRRKAAYQAFSALAKTQKSWKRMGHLIDLAMEHGRPDIRSIADIGTDHGLLAMGLAFSGQFEKVLGVDASRTALEQGAFTLWDQVLRQQQQQQQQQQQPKVNDNFTATLKTTTEAAATTTTTATVAATTTKRKRTDLFVATDLQEGSVHYKTTNHTTTIIRQNNSILHKMLEFRIGNGLQNIHPGEADAICMAGIGVRTIKEILQTPLKRQVHKTSMHTISGSSSLSPPKTPLPMLDYLDCQQLVLQPAKSRPAQLVELYDLLQAAGWSLIDERIEYLTKTWFLSSCFMRQPQEDHSVVVSSTTCCLPTSQLLQLNELHPMKQTMYQYWQHHVQWLNRDEKASQGQLSDTERRWRQWVMVEAKRLNKGSLLQSS